MMGEIGRSPVLAAPSFNNVIAANSTTTKIGEDEDENQADEANDLCKRYRPLALKIASDYRGRGIHIEDLRSAADLGLVLASRRFDPARGAFGPYAKHWIAGEVKALFKGSNPLNTAQSLTVNYVDDDSSHQADVADASTPVVSLDLGALDETERSITQARASGETLKEIGKTLRCSAERIRQREVRARSKIRGIIASECLSDLTKRGEVIRHPGERTRGWAADFRDREPPKHTYREPKPSREILHHRANASRLADLRGNEPLRNPRGPFGGSVIHGWGCK